MTRVIIRADAGPSIGSGHLMRAAALAEALHRQGADVGVLAAGVPARTAAWLGELGMTSTMPPAVSPDSRDAEATIAAARNGDADARWVVVDGYHFESTYMNRLLDAGLRVAWVDDLNALPAYPADVVVNPTLGAERCAYRSGTGTRVLAGGTYAFLRAAFAEAAARRAAADPQRIVIALGGADPGRLTPRVVRAVLDAALHDARVTVVVGPSNPNVDDVRRAAAGADHVTVVQDPADWPGLLAGAALVIAAAGITTWELAALGVPMLLIVAAENQARGASAIAEADAAEVVRADAAGDLEDLPARVAELWNNAGRRASMAARARRLIDGRGASRVARWIIDGAQLDRITLRAASREDAVQVWRINSEPSVRAESFDDRPILLGHHFDWFDNRLTSPTCRMSVLVREDEVAAIVRYDRLPDGDAAELGFAVASPFRRLGLGSRVLAETWGAACDELRVPAVRGFVIKGNDASIGAFRRAGFNAVGSDMRAGRECLVFERRAA